MFFSKERARLRPSMANWHQNDQLPFLARARFSALPHFRASHSHNNEEKLSLFVAVLYVIDMFGAFPFIMLPGLLVQLGFFGVPLVISVLVLQIYTSFLLSQCWIMAEELDPSIVHKSRYPYAAIANLAYGRHASFLVTILLDLSTFAGGIPNIIMAAENLEMLGNSISESKSSLSFCYWTILVGMFLAPLTWLGSPKRMRGLAIFSVCVIVFIVSSLWICLFSATAWGSPFQGMSFALPLSSKLLKTYCMLVFQFDIHPMLLTLQIDMQQKQLAGWAAFIGIAVTCSLAMVGSAIAAYKFGAMIGENVLRVLPTSPTLYITSVLMSLQLCFSVTANSSAMFLQLENYFKISENFSIKRMAIRTSVVVFQVVISEFVPSFDALMDIVGGTITGPLVFIMPTLFYRRLVRMEYAHQRTVTEASYGSIALDLNYNPIEDLSPQLLLDENLKTQSILRVCWQQAVYTFVRLQCDLSLSVMILFFGALVTFFATYLNIFELSTLFHNNSPCFGNFTALNKS
uniref:Amino acid transporter transmembrane domain-containing protein n=1 Tax=Glossina pallidipes TaxID=7398 RepID=A0A1A9ZDT4_GLOPL